MRTACILLMVKFTLATNLNFFLLSETVELLISRPFFKLRQGDGYLLSLQEVVDILRS